MDSWEDEDFEVPSIAPLAVSGKTAWDDEEEPEEAAASSGPAQPTEKQVCDSGYLLQEHVTSAFRSALHE